MTMDVAAQTFDPAIDVEAIREHPENPNVGDDERVGDSIDQLGFFGAILVQSSTGRIMAGNTRYRAARERGAETVPGFWLDVDDDTARRIMLYDNRSRDFAVYDDAKLVDLLNSLALTDVGLVATGFDAADLDSLQHTLSGIFDEHGSQLAPFDKLPAQRRRSTVRAIQTNANPAMYAVAHYLGWQTGVMSQRFAGSWLNFLKGRVVKPRLAFMDNEWKGYVHARHVADVEATRPIMATVRDLMTREQCAAAGIEFFTIEQTIEMATEIVERGGVEDIILIPKFDCLDRIPDTIAGARVVLGYSVPSSYGATPLDPMTFMGRPIHLLGGPWRRQRALLHLLGESVVSFDNNHYFMVSHFGRYCAADGTLLSINDLGYRHQPGAITGVYIACCTLSLLFIMQDLLAWGVEAVPVPDPTDEFGEAVAEHTDEFDEQAVEQESYR